MPHRSRQPHFAFPGEQIYCPNGHKIDHNVWAISEDPMVVRRCEFKWEAAGAGRCNTCVYWILMPGGYRIVKEVTSSEAHEMEQQRMTVKEVVMFLGLRWQRPVDITKPPEAPAAAEGAR